MNLSVGRVIWWAILGLIVAGLIYSGVWHLFTFFIWAHPMLSWVPILAFYLVGVAVGFIQRGLKSAQSSEGTPSPEAATGDSGRLSNVMGSLVIIGAPVRAASPPKRIPFAAGWGLATGILLLLVGLWFTLIDKPALGLDQIHYTVITKLPDHSEPRLLPRAGIDDDPGFRDADEIHLVRNPTNGKLLWTGEWRGSLTGGESHGVVVQNLDDITHNSTIIHVGFQHAINGITPNSMQGKAYIKHPFSRIQYPIAVPTASDKVEAIAPYMGYHGFPFKYPTTAGVLVYTPDGDLKDLTPDEAAADPDLAATGRLVPEKVARSEAEAISRSDQFQGDIDDGEDNKQPYLTAIDKDTTDWVTIIDDKNETQGVRAIVFTDSTTGDTSVWQPPKGQHLISTQRVVDTARSLPLQFTATRCCDSNGDSETVTLRQVVEPRLAFRNGHPYYMVSVVPTDDLILSREIEYTLVIDAYTGKTVHKYDHVSDPNADAKLQAFFNK